ncbi:recombinase family protein [Butyrivibrio sp. NC2007]|uniref:recombinase family protein n=1 Tax=Butyrivibrio sp. NC2007 TaxID=1280683 RepID=UPI0003B3B416|nr:recombinase family protein [Butyrivibrio sp. NC2007]
MTYAEEIRRKINNSEPLKAVAYYRVSTDNEGQKESCANQQLLAKQYLSTHQSIVLIAEYVDDGISGKNTFTRPQYNAMLQKILTGDIDLVITKSLSRLNRDQENTFVLKNILIDTETALLTLEDYQVLDLEDMNSDLLLSFKSTMDAQYVRQQSIYGKNAQKVRCEKRILGSRDVSFGYTWNKETKTISINETEAEAVRWLFEEYVYRNATPSSIYKHLKSMGFQVCERTIINYIKDERYIGRFYMNKWDSRLGTGSKHSKKFKLPKEKWVLVERPDLQIIDDDLFNLAQKIRQARMNKYDKPDSKTTQARFQGTHKYSGKVFCPVCGKSYQFDYADTKRTIPLYRIKKHSECSNNVCRITEQDLENITRQSLIKTLEQQDSICDSLEKILTDCVKSVNESDAEITKLHKQIVSKESQVNSLIDTLAEGGLTEVASSKIKERINKITSDIEDLTETIKYKESCKLDDSYISEKISKIKAGLDELKTFDIIDRNRILTFIDRIELPPDGTIHITLKSGQTYGFTNDYNTHFHDILNTGKMRNTNDPCSSPVTYRRTHRL